MRYLLFAIHPWNESGGGWGDFKTGSDTLEDLRKYLEDNRAQLMGHMFHIVDLKHMEVIEEGEI